MQVGRGTSGMPVTEGATNAADHPGGGVATGDAPRSRSLGPLLVAASVVYAFAAGYLVWRWTWADPRVPRTAWLEPGELEPAFGSPVGWESSQTGDRSWSTFVVGDDGRIVVETLHVTSTLPATGPPLPLRGMDDVDRHARDLAFAEGEEAFERFQREQGWGAPRPEPPDLGPIHVDVEVACLRVVVSSTRTPSPSAQATQDLEELVLGRLRAWFDDPANAEHCTQLWGYP
jgi:hypothetical protein